MFAIPGELMNESNLMVGDKPKDTDAKHCVVCQKISTAKCSNCGSVYYCSAEHQKTDWKNHKKSCFPITIRYNEKLGRYLTASRDIKQGEIIIKESPLVCGPSQITGPTCVGCLNALNQINYTECDKCGWPVCSENCKTNKNHRGECELTVARGSKVSIKNFFVPHPTYQCVTAIRCLKLQDLEPEIWNKFNQLESHNEERRGSAQWQSDREGIAKFIQRFLKCDRWTEDEILRVTGILQINGHEVPLADPPYIAVYHMASFFEHSCIPNVSKSFSSKGEIIFWAPKPIKKDTNLSICYSDALWGTAARQQHLIHTKMFRCQCIRCEDVTEFNTCYSAIRCSDAECSGLILPDSLENLEEKDWKCNICNCTTPYIKISQITERAGKDLVAMGKGLLENCLKYMDFYKKWLPENHYYMTDVKIAIAQLIGSGGPLAIQNITDDQLQMKVKYSQELLKLLDIIAPAETRCIGSIHFELHSALAEIGRRASIKREGCFKAALEDSLLHVEEAIKFLSKEPKCLPEGQICKQAEINCDSLKLLLGLKEL